LYFRNNEIGDFCTLNYVYYFPARVFGPAKAADNKIRIGSFNLFHLGDNLSIMKNFDLVAQILNQWDVVGAQELMPLPSEYSKDNRKIAKIFGTDQNGNDIEWTVIEPGYLRLLRALRKLDPSWALIMQPNPEGEGSTGEMAGFYFRTKTVGLKKFDYCLEQTSGDVRDSAMQANYGCVVRVPEGQRRLMSRSAFAAYFFSGKFDFVALTAHVRFRPAGPEDRVAQIAELCKNHPNPARCKPSKDEVGRFYEVKAVVDQMNDIKKATGEDDIIYMGDYNLELKKSKMPMWEAALAAQPGLRVYQDDPTTLSVPQQKLASNYDHFIFDPVATSECSPSTVRVFDFTSHTKKTKRPVHDAIDAKMTAKARDQMLEEKKEEIATIIRPQSGTVASMVRRLSPKEEESFLKSFRGSLLRMERNSYGAALELMSDHVPIEMECQVD
ncbi:MAG TPA: hypothetical protein VM432_09210, partial [Bdellovibrionales bacterium]|nr:hypothetical protein [Bdellovibrionales bacterium]